MPEPTVRISLIATSRWLLEGLVLLCRQPNSPTLIHHLLWRDDMPWPDQTDADVCALVLDPDAGLGQPLLQAHAARTTRVPTVAVVTQHDPLFMKQLLRDHADAYLTLDQGFDEWLQAIDHVTQGDTYVPRPFMLLVSGLNHQKIAAQLHISEKTVSSHKTNILNRLGLGHLPDLVRYHDKHPFTFKDTPESTQRG
jgi:DNA-binding NarL/FixJ family response regulator